MTARADWNSLLGVPLTEVSAAWHVPGEGCEPMPWAYFLEFDDGSMVTVALGELHDGAPTYQPDALLVFFTDGAAADYLETA